MTESDMRKRCVCTLLVLMLIQTGMTDSGISVSHKWDGDHLSITCRLMGDKDTVSQINWEMTSSSNHTTTRLKLGIFHPVFGTYVFPKYNDTVEIQGNASSGNYTLRLRGSTVLEESQFCCKFMTFPSGALEQCTNTRINESTEEAQESEGPQGLLEERQVEQWALLVVGSTICLLSIAISLYYCLKYCCRHCCRRRRVFEVETYLTDQHTDSEGVTEEPPHQPTLPSPPHHQLQGFDPSKLYTKIKQDLLYGRLWKAYQGTAKAWGPTTQQGPQQQGPQQASELGPQKVYFLLGDHRASQREEPEEPELEPNLEQEQDPQPTLEGTMEPQTEPEPIHPLALEPGTQMEVQESECHLELEPNFPSTLPAQREELEPDMGTEKEETEETRD
ncbi:uncharacterized protein ACWYII_026876 isoform 1-T1 [Salvelinus alpinus]|uniref:uncharacterized protein si:ch211-196f2.6 isoform X1 n=1 Tax=Salvelinus sp. IW2-2015 TaxID=2691554 RepID=UPI000CDFC613|nr:uncharacterized protein LOC111952242 isoform X1 [Salvelinus alpinus]